MDNSKAVELVEMLASYANSYNHRSNTDEFVALFKRQHRTLQQAAFKMFLTLMEHMASSEYQTDGRNEASKKVAQNLMEGYKLMMKKMLISQGESEEYAERYSNDFTKPSQMIPFI